MASQEVSIKQNVSIILKSDTEQLEEVMVVAYGTAKKSAFTGSAATIKNEKIATRQTSNVTIFPSQPNRVEKQAKRRNTFVLIVSSLHK